MIAERRERKQSKRLRDRDRKGRSWGPLVNYTQLCEHHKFDNSSPDLAKHGQVPDEVGVGKVSSAFKLCGHF